MVIICLIRAYQDLVCYLSYCQQDAAVIQPYHMIEPHFITCLDKS